MNQRRREMRKAKRERIVAERKRLQVLEKERRKLTYSKKTGEWVAQDKHWYREYLKTAHWQDFKAHYQQSDQPQCCVICGLAPYELHHLSYDHLGSETFDDVVALCRKHHSRAHKQERKGIPLREAHL